MKIVKVDSKEPSRKYPYLGKHNEYSFVVLFTAPNTAMVVQSDSVGYPIGDYSKNWNEKVFSPFNGKIVLSND